MHASIAQKSSSAVHHQFEECSWERYQYSLVSLTPNHDQLQVEYIHKIVFTQETNTWISLSRDFLRWHVPLFTRRLLFLWLESYRCACSKHVPSLFQLSIWDSVDLFLGFLRLFYRQLLEFLRHASDPHLYRILHSKLSVWWHQIKPACLDSMRTAPHLRCQLQL